MKKEDNDNDDKDNDDNAREGAITSARGMAGTMSLMFGMPWRYTQSYHQVGQTTTAVGGGAKDVFF